MSKELYSIGKPNWKEQKETYSKPQIVKKPITEPIILLAPEPEMETIIQPEPNMETIELEPPEKWDGYDPMYAMNGGIPKTWRQKKFDEYYTYKNNRELWGKRKAMGYWDDKKPKSTKPIKPKKQKDFLYQINIPKSWVKPNKTLKKKGKVYTNTKFKLSNTEYQNHSKY